MNIETIVTTAFQQNTRLVSCPKTARAVCIDPGGDGDFIAARLRTQNLDLQAIMLTHAHLDHIGGVADLHRNFPQAEIVLHKDDEEMYYALPEQPLFMGIPHEALPSLGMNFEKPPALTRFWTDEEIYAVGELNFKVRHCPGHTRGHVVFCEESERKIFVGDCLFAGSIGRTDLPGGDYDQLIASIIERILPFGDDVTVYTGHGADTSLGHEKATNPFLINQTRIGRGRFV